jgi:hypothetical protein
MSIEAYTDGKRTLFRERKPSSYAKPRCLGPAQLRWIAARGWLAGPRVERKESAA